MIKRILLIIILLGPMLSYSQKTYVPDDIFEAWLEGNGYGDSIPYNDSVLTSSISVITQLDIYNKNISDLTGISDMPFLTNLNASNNSINTLDLSGLYQFVNNKKISKYDLLSEFNNSFKNKLKLIPKSDYKIDKSLINTRKDFYYDIPTYQIMIKEMRQWIIENKNIYSHYKLMNI